MITIRYCKLCRLRRRAERLAEKIEQQIGIKVRVEEGRFEEFSIAVNDKIIAEKSLFFFPKEEDVIKAIHQNISAAG